MNRQRYFIDLSSAPPALRFFIPGQPQPGGSKKAFLHPHTKRIIITDDAKKNADWKRTVAFFASQQYKDQPLDGPLVLCLSFIVTRPKGHYGSGRNAYLIKPAAPAHPCVKPDVTKLIRSTEDALTGIVWTDDRQVVRQYAEKRYGPQPGCWVEVYRMSGPAEQETFLGQPVAEATA